MNLATSMFYGTILIGAIGLLIVNFGVIKLVRKLFTWILKMW